VVVAVEVVTGAAEPPVAVLQASAAVAVLVGLERVVAYTAIARLRRTGVLAKPTLVVGGGAVAASLSDVLLAHPEYGLQPVGLVDDEPLPGTEDPPVPRLSGPQGLQALVAEHGARAVIVAYGSAPESSVVDALRACDRLSCEVYVVPRLFELRGPGGDVESVWGIPLVRLRRSTFRTLGWRAKRVVDVVLAATAAVLLAPVLGACALLVRLETGPKVLFRQQRIGMDGRPFDVLKFRSLRPASDRESAQLWSVAADDRIGPIGRILRRTSLDELPQLWNILRGDMSLVGPRPERPHFVAEFASQFPRYDDRHRVPVGLTGWSQVNGLRGDTSIADRTRFDNDYIENWSLWLDVKILLRTVGQVLRGAGR
jgi:exopolysaccharide biosynthesis polyprenyl glycosylphosphotransferase